MLPPRIRRLSFFGSFFVTDAKCINPTPTIDVNKAITKVEEVLYGKKNDIEPILEHFALQDGVAALVHVFLVPNKDRIQIGF
ncbi:hypothetical protein PQX77_015989 [Marasmius sp. AFHP31]|nr:hypothetical protein PQX77_015989 [Marasmius sp. AFHP31]